MAQQQKANPGAAAFGMTGMMGQSMGPCKPAVSGVHPNVLETDLVRLRPPRPPGAILSERSSLSPGKRSPKEL